MGTICDFCAYLWLFPCKIPLACSRGRRLQMKRSISKWMLRVSMMAVVMLATQPLQAELVEKAKKVGGTTVHYKVVLQNSYDPAKAYTAILALGRGPQTINTYHVILNRNFRY